MISFGTSNETIETIKFFSRIGMWVIYSVPKELVTRVQNEIYSLVAWAKENGHTKFTENKCLFRQNSVSICEC